MTAVSFSGSPGDEDARAAAAALAARLPTPLGPFARIAFNYRWSWDAEGAVLFSRVDPHRWALCQHNPVRLLSEASAAALARAAGDADLLADARALEARIEADRARPFVEGPAPVDAAHPVAFFCAEYGIHTSLPLYSGGLGVLAGDILKEASDRALPFVAVGLLYRQGYFHQRLDTTGLQHEFWIDTDPERLPAVRVTGGDGSPLRVLVPLRGRSVALHIWRVQVGRVPLFLLDAELAENAPVDRWITARLYDGNRAIRLAQYAVLGLGGMRALRALGIDPGVVHLNEGHAAFVTLEIVAQAVARGASFAAACDEARQRVVFTTHTPVAAGNETHPADRLLATLPHLPEQLGTTAESLLALGRIHPEDGNEPPGMTVFALRLSRTRNAVSRRHGEVARAMWRPAFPTEKTVPIGHITNGVHPPSWIAPPMARLLEMHLGADLWQRTADPATWQKVGAIPDDALWAARNAARTALVDYVREHAVRDRLRRGEPLDYVEAAERTFDPGLLTMGFARRLATYKRLHLVVHDAERAIRLLQGPQPLQFLFAGKAHPLDDGAKRIVQLMFTLKSQPPVAGRVAFLEDHDLAMSAMLVAGCDLWLNLPRPPLEASGTSGMKAALNGVLNLSVLDGWWAEAWDGTNGWAVEGETHPDEAAQDARDATALYDLLEHEVVPLFYDRDANGVPHGWITRIKHAWKTLGPRFTTARMLDDYRDAVWASPPLREPSAPR